MVWHCRLLLSQVSHDCWIVATPDLDVYEEQLSLANPDYVDFRFLGPSGVIPPDIPPGSVYGFQPIDPATLAGLRVQANAMALAARALLPAVAPPPAVVPAPPPPPGMLVPHPPAAPHVAGQPPAAPAAAVGAGVADTWVVVEDGEAHKKGDVVAVDPNPLPPGHMVAGLRGIIPSGTQHVLMKKVPASEAALVKLDDVRLLPVHFDGQGTRRREFNVAVAMLQDVVPQGGGLQLQGPTSILNMMKMFRDQNFTPTTFHEHWVRTADLAKGDRSVFEHECLSRIIESMITVDQLNLPCLQSAELLARRMQVIREAHRICPSAPDYSSADVMMGWKYRKSTQGVDSELAAHVAAELKNEAMIAKESRKAREENESRRQRARPKTKGNKGGGDDQ